MAEATDSQLMERYALGDEQAFETLFRRYEARAYGFFLRRTRSPEAARDLYQEVFLRVHRFRRGFDSSHPFEPWFFAIASHVFIDHLRSRHGFQQMEDDPPDRDAQVDAAERQAIARVDLQQLLSGLSLEQRGVVLAAKADGFDYAEIASELGKSVAAVKQTASRALRRLRARGDGR